MTAATLTHLPLAAGGAVLVSAGRAAGWAFSRYMRAPLTHTAILAMVTLTAMAGSNALYMQAEKHPAPLFAPQEAATPVPRVLPVVPATRPLRREAPAIVSEPVPEPAAVPLPTEPIGNAEVFELQRKLLALEMFEGTVDGYYGPQTARAIRAFETANGLRPTGELTAALIEQVRSAPLRAPATTPLVAPDPVAESAGPVLQPVGERAAEPSALAAVLPAPTPEAAPLPAPEPLPAMVQQPAAARTPATAPLRRELPATPQQAVNIAVDTAGEAIETIIEGVQTVTMTTRPQPRPPAEVEPAPAAVTTIAPGPAASTSVPSTTLQLASAPPVAVPGRTLVVSEPEPLAELPPLDTDARPEELRTFSVTDPETVAQVQRGLASLGFLHGPADGVAGEATAKAIRNFEVYYNYDVTGRISPELLDLLVQNGAAI